MQKNSIKKQYKKILSLLIFAAFSFGTLSFLSKTSAVDGGITVFSSDMTDGTTMSSTFACSAVGAPDGLTSPQLSWSIAGGAPASYVILMHDEFVGTPAAYDAGGDWSHWAVYNIPSGTTSVPQNSSMTSNGGGIEAINTWGEPAGGGMPGEDRYRGPCPPPSGTHNYFFTVYALSATITPAPTGPGGQVTTGDMLAAMTGLILDQGDLQVTFANSDIGSTPADTTPPITPVAAPDLTAATDSGISNSDNITMNDMPDFDVVCTEAGSQITLLTDNPAPDSFLSMHTCVGVGTETVTAMVSMVEGEHMVTYFESDAAFNMSGQSPALGVTIDLTAPTAPVVNQPAEAEVMTAETFDVEIECAEIGTQVEVSNASLSPNPTLHTCNSIGPETFSLTTTMGGDISLEFVTVDMAGNRSQVTSRAITAAEPGTVEEPVDEEPAVEVAVATLSSTGDNYRLLVIGGLIILAVVAVGGIAAVKKSKAKPSPENTEK